LRASRQFLTAKENIMSISSKGYTSSYRGSNAPGAFYHVGGSEFGTFGSPNTHLGVAGSYALLGGAGVTNTGATVINAGNVGSFPTASITGFPPGVIVPPAGIDNANANAAQTALTAAISYYEGLVFTSLGTAVNMSTNTGGGGGAGVYHAGNYSSTSSLDIPTSITLDAQGNPNAVFVFWATASTITLESGASILLVNGAKADNVIWVAGSSFTSVATSNMVGTILAVASATLGGGTLVGRALAGSGSVTIAAATVVTAEPLTSPSIQNPLPLVPANGTADYVLVVPNTGSQWKVQKSVHFSRPNGTTETTGITIDGVDCISPVYPGVGVVVTAGTTPASYMILNGYLFQATASGTTAATFIGFSKFNTTKGATTTDGTVVWTSFGKAAIIRARFANSSLVAATPVAQEYDWFEL
jgi:hypothetical protein